MLRQDGSLVLYAKLYSGAGSLTGELSFSAGDTPELGGTLFWSHPQADADNIETELSVTIAR